jgi:hypothetical protein
MNQRGVFSPAGPRKGTVIWTLLLSVLWCAGGVGADEKYGMPSESEARRQGHAGAWPTSEQIVRIESLSRQEDMLIVNGEAFVVKNQARFEDEGGARIDIRRIPLGAKVELQYHMGSRLEDSGYGPNTRILTKLRIVEPPPKKTPAP